MNILIAVDGSEASRRAVEHAIALAGECRSQPTLHLLYVHPPIPIGFAAGHVSRETLDAYYREEGERELAPARAQLEAARIAYTSHVHVGQPGETICRVAQELGCQMIAMGTHGRGALAGMLLGSVAAKVSHFATVPVLLVH